MARIALDTDGLFTRAALYGSPNDKERLNGIKARFAEWTGEATTSAIYSGYRARILERFGCEASKRRALELRENFESMVVLGIGGSALGARTVVNALNWTVPHAKRKQVLIADNLDPIDFEDIWASINPTTTCFVVISKSGGTLETMSQTSAVIERLERAELDVSRHVVAITDPSSGALRNWVNSSGVMSLEIPSNVGGRFSVFTPVGLLPIAFAGIDIDSLMDGAVAQLQNLEMDAEKLALTGLRLAELEESGFSGHTLMPYSTKLKDFGAWFVQLWGESLGKERPRSNAVGMIPVAAVGATDQHSLLQLLVEGPNRIVTGFVRVEEWPQTSAHRAVMGKLPPEFAGLSYAHGKSFGQILNAEETATRTVLSERGRPVYQIRLADAGPQAVGALLALYMDLTVYTAAALGVNPFDQPGVELGKKLMPKLLSD